MRGDRRSQRAAYRCCLMAAIWFLRSRRQSLSRRWYWPSPRRRWCMDCRGAHAGCRYGGRPRNDACRSPLKRRHLTVWLSSDAIARRNAKACYPSHFARRIGEFVADCVASCENIGLRADIRDRHGCCRCERRDDDFLSIHLDCWQFPPGSRRRKNDLPSISSAHPERAEGRSVREVGGCDSGANWPIR
ncbi:MAG: hypothetical protein ACI89X_001200 [Planctomycetota bacterium]|jgi:hypothetical protein